MLGYYTSIWTNRREESKQNYEYTPDIFIFTFGNGTDIKFSKQARGLYGNYSVGDFTSSLDLYFGDNCNIDSSCWYEQKYFEPNLLGDYTPISFNVDELEIYSPSMIEKVVSGGQTGVDRAALDAAIELKIPHGGWCPKGRLAELGTSIPEKYSLNETTSSNFSERTKLNVKDSDGTLILLPNIPSPEAITGGTNLTIKEVQEKRMPYLIIDLSKQQDFDSIIEWVKSNNINVLNIAGPRESLNPGLYQQSLNFLKSLLPFLTNT
ncbi:hypothetical protein G9A89_017612 [Geosiphon pyriformis]|nr:hypothetical protein G9A89_017612 [Geosiphon pyriformis]